VALTMDTAADDLAKAREGIEERLVDLAHIAAWQDDLSERLWRARWQIEICGLDENEQDRLVAEVRAFHRVCKALGWRAK
jgi:hypothetical protein